MVGVVCFSGVQVLYISMLRFHMVLASLLVSNRRARASLTMSFCGYLFLKSKPALSSMRRSRPRMSLEWFSNR